MKAWMVAVAVIVIVVVVAAGGLYALSIHPTGTGTGTLVVGMKDSPIPSNVTHLYLTITAITLQGEGNTTTTYSVNATQFDLLKLTSVTKFLGSNKVPAGNYTMIRFTVTSAIATVSGANQTLNVPSGEVKASDHFQVVSGKTTTIVLDVTADMTHISAAWNLRPVLVSETVTGPD